MKGYGDYETNQANVIYARVVPEGKYVAICYWYYFVYNEFNWDYHEGDPEGMVVLLDAQTLEPPKEGYCVGYAQHYGGVKFTWDTITKDQATGRPIVYIAKGGHASYPKAGNWKIIWPDYWLPHYAPLFYDETRDGREPLDLNVMLLTNQPWLDFKGYWGARHLIIFDSSVGTRLDPPRGFNEQERWNKPVEWVRGLDDVLKSAGEGIDVSVGSPVVLSISDEQGRRIGFEDGQPVCDIPDAGVTADGFFVPLGGDYLVELRGIQEGEASLNIGFHEAGYSKTIGFEDIPITDKTVANLRVSLDEKDYLLQLDEDGDGTVDEEKAPDFMEENYSPYTPSNPSPGDGAVGVLTNAGLSWTGGDPDTGDTVTYDVYFGTSASAPLVSNNQSSTTYNLGTLAYNTKYYWKVIATDEYGASTPGPVWDFTTLAPLGPTVTWNLPYGMDEDPTAINIYTYQGVAVTLAAVDATMPDGLLIWYYGGPGVGYKFYKKGWGAYNTLTTMVPNAGLIGIVPTASVWNIPQG